MHAEATDLDVLNFEIMQSLLALEQYKHLSKRLAIEKRLRRSFKFWPFVWDLVKVKHMMTEEELLAKSPDGTGVPDGEKLFVLEGM